MRFPVDCLVRSDYMDRFMDEQENLTLQATHTLHPASQMALAQAAHRLQPPHMSIFNHHGASNNHLTVRQQFDHAPSGDSTPLVQQNGSINAYKIMAPQSRPNDDSPPNVRSDTHTIAN